MQVFVAYSQHKPERCNRRIQAPESPISRVDRHQIGRRRRSGGRPGQPRRMLRGPSGALLPLWAYVGWTPTTHSKPIAHQLLLPASRTIPRIPHHASSQPQARANPLHDSLRELIITWEVAQALKALQPQNQTQQMLIRAASLPGPLHLIDQRAQRIQPADTTRPKRGYAVRSIEVTAPHPPQGGEPTSARGPHDHCRFPPYLGCTRLDLMASLGGRGV